MATKRISVNVDGLWRTYVELTENALWRDLKTEIKMATGICEIAQHLTPNGDNFMICEFEDGDDVMCEMKHESDHNHPLHCASSVGSSEAIRSWIASGADVDVKSESDATPLMSASFFVEEICVKELLQYGANARHVSNYDNATALHNLTSGLIKWMHYDVENAKNIAKMLVAAGCDPTIRNADGVTAFELLQQHKCNEFAKHFEEFMNNIV